MELPCGLHDGVERLGFVRTPETLFAFYTYNWTWGGLARNASIEKKKDKSSDSVMYMKGGYGVASADLLLKLCDWKDANVLMYTEVEVVSIGEHYLGIGGSRIETNRDSCIWLSQDYFTCWMVHERNSCSYREGEYPGGTIPKASIGDRMGVLMHPSESKVYYFRNGEYFGLIGNMSEEDFVLGVCGAEVRLKSVRPQVPTKWPWSNALWHFGIWTRGEHHHWPRQFRAIVMTLLLLQKRPDCVVSLIPKDVVMIICAYLSVANRDYFGTGALYDSDDSSDNGDATDSEKKGHKGCSLQ